MTIKPHGIVLFTGISGGGQSVYSPQIEIDLHGAVGDRIHGLWVKDPSKVIKDKDIINAQYSQGRRLIFQHQICIIDTALINQLKKYGIDYINGQAREQLVIDGVVLSSLRVGTRIYVGSCVLEVVSLKSFCQSFFKYILIPEPVSIDHVIRKISSDFHIPHYGLFTKVIQTGVVSTGDIVVFDVPSNGQELTGSINKILDSRHQWLSMSELEKIYSASICDIARTQLYGWIKV